VLTARHTAGQHGRYWGARRRPVGRGRPDDFL